MVNYGRQRSTIKPPEIELTENKVFIASNIIPIEELKLDEQQKFIGFEFDLVEYSKDEYIKVQAEKNAVLENEVITTQMALCEVYESMT